VIQVNTICRSRSIARIDLACHEGYPGHHVYNSLLEKNLVRDRGWVEFSVYPLFSPQSLIAEGTANFGIEVAFPARSVRRSSATRCIRWPAWRPDRRISTPTVQRAVAALSYAGNEAARRLPERRHRSSGGGRLSHAVRDDAKDRAEQRTRFFDSTAAT
jgi:hypothetical protein